MSSDEYRAVTNHLKEKETCRNCGHPGSMHSDGENTHTGECFTIIGKTNKGDIFCDCKECVLLGADE